MKAIILAAGRGSRMQGATDYAPKCMFSYKGKPLIEHIVENLEQFFDRKDIHIVSGYRAGDLDYLGLDATVNDSWNSTNIVGSLQKANHLLMKESAVITYSDIYYEQTAISQLLSTELPALVSTERWLEIWSRRFENPLSDLESFKLSELGTLKQIGGRASDLSEIEGQFAGIFSLSPDVWNWIKLEVENFTKKDSTTVLNEITAHSPYKVSVVKYQGLWAEIDTLQDAESQT